VVVKGQVVRPGTYVFDQDHPSLSQVIARAGGLTSEAMPKAGMLLRSLQTEAGPYTKAVGEIMERLNETKIMAEKASGTTTGELTKGILFRPPVLHGLSSTILNRMVVDFEGALKGNKDADTELMDGDQIIIPRTLETAYVVGETSSPFGTYKVKPGMDVGDLLKLAGGTTRNADGNNIRLVKADGRIMDSWVERRTIEPGDTVVVPQRIKRDSTWQESMTALTSLALILNALAATGHL